MTDRDLCRLEALLEQFRDEQVWHRREDAPREMLAGRRVEEHALSLALGTIRRTRQGRPLYRSA